MKKKELTSVVKHLQSALNILGKSEIFDKKITGKTCRISRRSKIASTGARNPSRR
jgi:hypothetical protein